MSLWLKSFVSWTIASWVTVLLLTCQILTLSGSRTVPMCLGSSKCSWKLRPTSFWSVILLSRVFSQCFSFIWNVEHVKYLRQVIIHSYVDSNSLNCILFRVIHNHIIKNDVQGINQDTLSIFTPVNYIILASYSNWKKVLTNPFPLP